VVQMPLMLWPAPMKAWPKQAPQRQQQRYSIDLTGASEKRPYGFTMGLKYPSVAANTNLPSTDLRSTGTEQRGSPFSRLATSSRKRSMKEGRRRRWEVGSSIRG